MQKLQPPKTPSRIYKRAIAEEKALLVKLTKAIYVKSHAIDYGVRVECIILKSVRNIRGRVIVCQEWRRHNLSERCESNVRNC